MVGMRLAQTMPGLYAKKSCGVRGGLATESPMLLQVSPEAMGYHCWHRYTVGVPACTHTCTQTSGPKACGSPCTERLGGCHCWHGYTTGVPALNTHLGRGRRGEEQCALAWPVEYAGAQALAKRSRPKVRGPEELGSEAREAPIRRGGSSTATSLQQA